MGELIQLIMLIVGIISFIVGMAAAIVWLTIVGGILILVVASIFVLDNL